jgi:hypothetical protein
MWQTANEMQRELLCPSTQCFRYPLPVILRTLSTILSAVLELSYYLLPANGLLIPISNSVVISDGLHYVRFLEICRVNSRG